MSLSVLVIIISSTVYIIIKLRRSRDWPFTLLFCLFVSPLHPLLRFGQLLRYAD